LETHKRGTDDFARTVQPVDRPDPNHFLECLDPEAKCQ